MIISVDTGAPRASSRSVLGEKGAGWVERLLIFNLRGPHSFPRPKKKGAMCLAVQVFGRRNAGQVLFKTRGRPAMRCCDSVSGWASAASAQEDTRFVVFEDGAVGPSAGELMFGT
jgi:hypothetical protein